MAYDYDLVVIGGGAAGLTAAKTAKGFGKRVLIVEKKQLGGECTWTGCVPSKTLIKIAQVAHDANHLSNFGLKTPQAIEINADNCMSVVRQRVQDVYSTHTPEVIRKMGIGVLIGAPTFVNKHTVLVDDKKITFKKCVIATGSRPYIPNIDGLDTVDYYTNNTIFNIDKMPRSLAILGGGAIGAELACAFNRLGVQVTVIEKQKRILPHEDGECVKLLSRHMQQAGIRVVADHKATKVGKQENGDIAITCVSSGGKQQDVYAQTLLVAVGRAANVGGLYLEKAGVKTHKRGIVVNDYLRTTARNIFAIGDVVGPYQFSHMAWHQAVTAARNAFIPFFKKKMNYDHVVWVTFSAPELATAGLTESEARKKYGKKIRIYRKEYKHFDRAVCDGQLVGMVKVICDRKGFIIGAHVVGARAGDIIHQLQLAKAKQIKLTELQPIIHAYPTYAEIIWHTAKAAYVDKLRRNIFLRILKKLFGK